MISRTLKRLPGNLNSCAEPGRTPLPGPGPAEFLLKDISVSYRSVPALRSLTLHVPPGSAVAFVGPSGAGKTTLLRLLNGSVRPDAGRVLVSGSCLGELSPAALKRVRTRIGFVHQDLSLIPNLRAAQNVLTGRIGRQSLFGSLRSVFFPGRAELRDVHRILERVGIAEKLFERTDHLSGGQRQRVALARALYQQPTCLLADEPVSSVDPARARDMLQLLTRISREQDLTLCMSLHNLELAREFFPRIVGLRHGRIVFDGAGDRIGEDTFDELYELTAEEILQDGG